MNDLQVSTNPDTPALSQPPAVELTDLNRLQMELLAHQACGGVFVDENGKTGRMTVEELATGLGVTRDALYKAKVLIKPDDWERLKKQVRERIWSTTRITKVWNGVFGRAAKGDYQQALLYLVNFSPDKVTLPAQKVEADVGDNLAEFLLLAQKRARENNLPESKIIDATDNNV